MARVELGAADERRDSRYDGQPAITVGIIKQAVANPLDVSNAVRKVMPEINQSLPQGLSATIGNDSAVFIDRSISAVYHTIGEAILLVVLVIIFFLRSMRASLIPIVTIPISLIATFTLLFAMGFTINTLTLLAMVLAIGLVVDDAIVVLENIYRRIEDGMQPIPAAIEGTKEIGFAVIAMTLTLAAVYAPIAFAPGRTGRLFLEFALALAGAVVVSGFVALTLTPMMCSKLLKHNPNPGRLFNHHRARLHGVRARLQALADGTLRRRMISSCWWRWSWRRSAALFFMLLQSELAPVEDRGLDPGARHRARGRDARLHAPLQQPGGRHPGQGARDRVDADHQRQPRGVALPGDRPPHRLGRAQALAAADQCRDQSEAPAHPGRAARPPAIPARSAQRGSSRPVEFVIQTSGTYEQLQEYVDLMLERIRAYPGLEGVETDLQLNMPEFRIDIDRAKVADLGLDVTVVGRTLETLLGGRQVTRFEQNGEQYDVIVQLAAEDRASPQTLSTIFLRSPTGEMVQLSNIVKVREAVAPKELQTLQPAARGDDLGQSRGGLCAGRCAHVPGADRARGAARNGADRCRRPEPRVPRGRTEPGARVSCWRWASSISCWRRSSRASAIRSSS